MFHSLRVASHHRGDSRREVHRLRDSRGPRPGVRLPLRPVSDRPRRLRRGASRALLLARERAGVRPGPQGDRQASRRRPGLERSSTSGSRWAIRVEVKGPEGRFVLDRAEGPVLLFAGGSGITPVISILKTALEDHRPSGDAPLREPESDVGHLPRRARAPRARLPRPLAGRPPLRRRARTGGRGGRARRVAGQRDASVFICGPAPFMGLVERAAVAAGASPECIRIERFTLGRGAGPAGRGRARGARRRGHTRVHRRSSSAGRTTRSPYKKGKTLLQTARDARPRRARTRARRGSAAAARRICSRGAWSWPPTTRSPTRRRSGGWSSRASRAR